MGKVTEDATSFACPEVLLLSQLLHARSIGDASALSASDDAVLSAVISEWSSHAFFRVYDRKPPRLDPASLKKLYSDLLTAYQATLTTELANITYFQRLAELDATLAECQEAFFTVLNEKD